jgi:hypothetical protein
MTSRWRTFALALTLSSGVLSHSDAQAQCERWSLGSYIDIVQDRYNIRLTFSKNRGGNFNGTAQYYFTNTEKLNGEIEGSLVGNVFEFTAFWENGSIGVYSGTITGKGRIFGETFDKAHPGPKQAWHSYRNLKCPNPNVIEARPPDVMKPDAPFKPRPRGDVVLAAPSFAGTWNSVTGEGVNYTLSLDSQGDGSVGAADPKLDGTMNGTLSADGTSMSFVMTQPSVGITSRGKLKLGDGGNSFDGQLTKDTDGKPLTFKGTRRK